MSLSDCSLFCCLVLGFLIDLLVTSVDFSPSANNFQVFGCVFHCELVFSGVFLRRLPVSMLWTFLYKVFYICFYWESQCFNGPGLVLKN